MSGGTNAEDGFIYLSGVQRLGLPSGVVTMHGGGDGGMLDGWLRAPEGSLATVAQAPAPPGREGLRPVVIVRHTATSGRYVSVWSWRNALTAVEFVGDEIAVMRRDGTSHRHVRTAAGWQILSDGTGNVVKRDLRGAPPARVVERSATPRLPREQAAPLALPATFELGEEHYRQSEFTWQGAGAPRAAVTVSRPTLGSVLVTIDIPSQRLFVPLLTENQLDNDPPSVHGDSVQLYAMAGARNAGVLLVPEGSLVGKRLVDGWNNELAVDARWQPHVVRLSHRRHPVHRPPDAGVLPGCARQRDRARARAAAWPARDVRRYWRIRLSSGGPARSGSAATIRPPECLTRHSRASLSYSTNHRIPSTSAPPCAR